MAYIVTKKTKSLRCYIRLVDFTVSLSFWVFFFFFKMEQIKRTNRLYTNDSIFLKKTLYIPILTEPRDLFNGLDSEEENDGEEEVRPRKDGAGSHSGKRKNQESGSGPANGEALPQHQETSTPIHDLSASDFLKKLDSQISLSKKAAAQKLRKGESG